MLIVVFFSFLTTTTIDFLGHCDIDLICLSLASLVLACLVATCNILGCGFHVDRHLLSPPFWLQLLMTLLVIVILILVV